jgi:hypothetical protein
MKGIATVFGLVLLAAPAHADATLDVLKAAGLLGTWAESCTAGPSRWNWFVTFYATGTATVRRKSETGGDDPMLDGAVDSAQRLTPTMVRLRLRNDDPNWGADNGAVYDTEAELRDGKWHVLSSVRPDGTQLIKDGKFVASGKPTPILQRCN